ncbi:Crp/Fnr family transcriptional regulator [Rhizobium sp. Rhizsp82]|uniref:Crp/Fnr family transcriptional regulator n=1 Tax=Rhizobium sp. Rhizsp82 TaxID=3243057 RepID=UPI0039B5BBA7
MKMGFVDRNAILLSLPQKEADALRVLAGPVPLPVGKVLEDPQRPIKDVWFIDQGVACSFVEARSVGRAGIGLVGPEGFIGVSLLDGPVHAATKVVVQVPGEGRRVDAADFLHMLRRFPTLEASCRDYCRNAFLQAAGTALANARGHIEHRVARWLLMLDDRLGQRHIDITHECLAAMLGVRRPGVTGALHVLEGTGVIRSTRGHVQILDREGLEAAARGFYGSMERLEPPEEAKSLVEVGTWQVRRG